MAKLTLTDLSNIFTAATSINNNNAAIEAAMENTLSRDGTSPNTMNTDLDMNNKRVYNLPEPITDGEPVRKGDIITLGEVEDIYETILEIQEDVEEDVIAAEAAAAIAVAAANSISGLSTLIYTDPAFDTRSLAVAANIPVGTKSIRTMGYSAPGDGGGVVYTRVNSEPTHPGKLQTADGAWWVIWGQSIPVEAFGAVADGSTNSTTAFQNAALFIKATGGDVLLGVGTYIVTSTILLDYTTTLLGKGSFKGKGLSQSEIFTNVTGLTPLFHIKGVWGSSEQVRTVIEGIGLRSETNAGIGWHLENVSYARLDRISAQGFTRGFKGTNTISITLQDCMFVANGVGLEGIRDGSSGPNAWLLNNCVLNGNSSLAVLLAKGATFTMIGGCVEGNGVHATTDNGGIYLNAAPDEGAQSLTAVGVYFEGNGGTGDIMFDVNDGDGANITVTGCTFNRISSSKFVSHNIALKKGAAGALHATITGNGFRGFNTYVANASRQYVGVAGALTGTNYSFNVHDNYYGSGTERPALPGPRSSDKAYASAWVRFTGATGAISFQHNVASVTRSAAGKYRINFSQPLTSSGHCAVATAVGVPHHIYLVDESASYVDIEAESKAGALADPPAISVTVFNF